MIAVEYSLKRDKTSGTKEKTEVYTTKIPKFSCITQAFARELIEMDFAESFNVLEYDPCKKIGKRGREARYYKGNFVFAPDVDISVYEFKHFARVYVNYDHINDDEVSEVREVLTQNGLLKRIISRKDTKE